MNLSRRIHDQLRVSLIGDRHQKLIFRFLQGTFLPFDKFLSLSKKLQCLSASHAAEGNQKHDAGTRKIDAELPLQSGQEPLIIFPCNRMKQKASLSSAQAEEIPDLAGG